jgi:hypothetical protein
MRTWLTAAFLLAISSGASAQIMEMNGTWKLNPERTLGPAPKVETLVYTIKPGEQAYTMDAIEADGRKEHVEWKAKYDGKDQPTGRDGGAPKARSQHRARDEQARRQGHVDLHARPG